MSINDEYYVMVDDFSQEKRLSYVMSGYASNYSHILQTEAITQPVRYNIHERHWEKGRSPEDIILDSDGLIIKNNLKEAFFDSISPDNMMMHLTYFVSPDTEYFEGYWLLSIPNKPKEWLNPDKTEFKYRSSDHTIRGIKSYFLDEALLSNIPFEKRQLFSWNFKDFGYSHQIIHKSWVDYLKRFDNRNVKFIPLLKFKSKMANQGPLPDFAI